MFIISLVNLSWTDQKLDSTYQKFRFWHGLSIGVTSVSVRLIGCSLLPGEPGGNENIAKKRSVVLSSTIRLRYCYIIAVYR